MKVGKSTYGDKNIHIKWGQIQFHRKKKIRYTPELIIGKYCSIAENVTVYLGGGHRTDWISTYPFAAAANGHPITNGDVIIGNDVWIGSGVTIMSGVHIGDGAVIAANSHVLSNVKSYSIVGGNPATLYGFRFSKENIDGLLRAKWWDWSDDNIAKIIPTLCSGDFEKFFKFVEDNKLGI